MRDSGRVEIEDDLKIVYGIISDITSSKQAAETLRKSEDQLRRVIESMPVMMNAFDAAGNIIVGNRECERVTGYSAQEIINNPQAAQMLYPNEGHSAYFMEQLLKYGGNFRDVEWEISCKDGSKKIISWSNISDQFPVPEWYSWAIGLDITERKEAEKELQTLNADLEKRIRERTAELQGFVNLMAGREVRMAELKSLIKLLRAQLQAAGLKPAADDPLTDF